MGNGPSQKLKVLTEPYRVREKNPCTPELLMTDGG